MRMLDIHPPPIVDVNGFSNTSCFTMSSVPVRSMSDEHSSQSAFEAGSWVQKRTEKLHTELQIKALHGETHYIPRNMES